MKFRNKIKLMIIMMLISCSGTAYADGVGQFIPSDPITEAATVNTVADNPVQTIYAKKRYRIVAEAKNNSGLYYDITAFDNMGKYSFVLPYGCDVTNVNITVYAEDGAVVLNTAVDFSLNEYESIRIDDTQKVEVSAFNSRLPVIYLDINEEYGTILEMNKSEEHTVPCYGDMVLEVPPEVSEKLGCESYMDTSENDSKPEQPGTVRLRGRGNSTWTTETDKQRPYQIKLEKGLNLLGMGKNKEWALLRTETPLKYIRNKLCFDMAEDFGMKYTPRAEFVDVFLNGNYIGMYTLSNPIDIGKNNVNITNMDDTIELEGNADNVDITGGYLLEMDNFTEKLQFLAQDNMITIKNPELLDDNAEDGSRYDYIKNLMTDMVNAVYGDGYLSDGRHFSEVLDMESAVKLLLHQELIGNYDCCQGSTFFYKDIDSVDTKIYMGPVWDCEFAFELYASEWCLPYRVRYWEPHQPLFVAELCRHKEFVDYLLAYYYDNVNNNNIREIYPAYADKVTEYENDMLNSAKASSALYNIAEPSNQYISNYIRSKYDFMEQNLKTLKNDATRGINIEIFNQTDDYKSDFSNIYRRGDKIHFTCENTSETDKTVVFLGYNHQNVLSLAKEITLKSGSRKHDYIVIDEFLRLSRVKIYDGAISTFENVSVKNEILTNNNEVFKIQDENNNNLLIPEKINKNNLFKQGNANDSNSYIPGNSNNHLFVPENGNTTNYNPFTQGNINTDNNQGTIYGGNNPANQWNEAPANNNPFGIDVLDKTPAYGTETIQQGVIIHNP